MKLDKLFEEFINYAMLERCLSPNTLRWYRHCYNPFIEYLKERNLPLTTESLTTDIIRQHFIEHRMRGKVAKSILGVMQGLKSFMTFLKKRGYIDSNPFRGIEKPRLEKRLPIFLDEKESKELLETCIKMKSVYKTKWKRDIAVIAMFLFTGIRRKELLNLRLRDLNLQDGWIRVFAKNKERIVPLNATVKAFLVDYLKVRPERTVDNIFVSTNRRDSALTAEGLGDVFRDIRKRVSFGKKLCPQVLRHTFATLMLRNGVNIRDIQLIVGHADISTTARFYLGCDEKQLKVAIDKHPLNI